MKKRVLALFLVVIITATLIPTTASAADSDFVIENGVLTKYNGPGGAVVIPEGVTSIGFRAFRGTNLTSVIIPNGVTTIEPQAFNSCVDLTSITIPDSVTYIGESAFSGCTNLTSITIPDRVTSIASNTFAGCTNLTSVNISNSITTIKAYAFVGCASLTGVVIPKGVTDIEHGVFAGCTSLVGIEVAPGNLNYCSENGVLFDKDKTELITYPGGKKGAYTVPSSVIKIGAEAFRFGTITSLNIGDNVTEIEYWAFEGCTYLTDATVNAANIGEGAFHDCTNLTRLIIGNNVTTIEFEAFANCDNLTNVTIPNGVTGIGSYAFHSCDNLTSVSIDDGATFIDYCAFFLCPNLTSITIPGSVTCIWNSAFSNCPSLTDVYFQGTQTQWDAIEIGYDNEYLTSATIHYMTEIATATLTNGNKTVSFSYTDVGKLILTEGQISQGEAVLVGCYDSNGRFTGVKWIDAQHATAQIDPNTPSVKLFWLGAKQNPQSPSVTVWGK